MSQIQDHENGDAAEPHESSSVLNLDAIKPGVIIDDRYQIISNLGAGGMCTVFLANHIILQRRVAVKVLHEKSLCDTDALKRFRREAVLVSGLAHPNIVKVFGFGFAGRAPFLAMEYIEGQSLAELLHQVGRLSPQEALPLFRQILSGLAEAHDKGIIHRDLKPSNIMLLGEEKTVKIVDFGIAKILPESGKALEKLTQSGSIFGTVAYMSPEQCRAEPLDARSDLYSVGCLMYEVLTGNQPFQGETILATMSLHLVQPPATSEYLSGKMAAIVLWALEKESGRRPQSASEMLDALNSDDDLSAFLRVTATTTTTGMQKRYLRLLGIVVLFLLSSVLISFLNNYYWGKPKEPKVAKAERFFKRDGISFSYPPDWILSRPQEGTIADFQIGKFGKLARLYVYGWPLNSSFSAIVAAQRQNEKDWNSLPQEALHLPLSDQYCGLVFDKVCEDRHALNDEDALHAAGSGGSQKKFSSEPSAGVEHIKEKIMFVKAKRLYLFILDTAKADFKENEKALKKILESVSFPAN